MPKQYPTSKNTSKKPVRKMRKITKQTSAKEKKGTAKRSRYATK